MRKKVSTRELNKLKTENTVGNNVGHGVMTFLTGGLWALPWWIAATEKVGNKHENRRKLARMELLKEIEELEEELYILRGE